MPVFGWLAPIWGLRMRLNLPTFLTALDVIGVTKGRPRWTVYFRNGARFTQLYANRTNIGYQAPIPHYFFANVDEDPILEIQGEIGAKYGFGEVGMQKYAKALCETYGVENSAQRKTVLRHPPRRNESTEGKRLVEIKQGSGALVGHSSSSALEPVTIDEATEIVAEIRGRSETIIAYPPNTRYFCFQ